MYRKIYALQGAESDIYHSKCQMSRNFATVKAAAAAVLAGSVRVDGTQWTFFVT